MLLSSTNKAKTLYCQEFFLKFLTEIINRIKEFQYGFRIYDHNIRESKISTFFAPSGIYTGIFANPR